MSTRRGSRPKVADHFAHIGPDQEDRLRTQKLEFARSKLAGPNGVSDKLRNVSLPYREVIARD